nr:uncharacterized protein LOC127338116 [Lolium perenne]
MYSQSAGIKRRRARAPGGAHAGEPPDTRQGPAAAALGLGRWSRPCQVSHGGGERHKLVPDPYYYESKKKYYYESKTSTPWGRGWMILAIEMGWARWSMAMGTETCLTEETLEIAMAGMTLKALAAARHMPAAHDRRTASMPSWCSCLLLMRPVYGCGSSPRRTARQPLVRINGHHPNSDFLLRTSFQLMHTNGDCSDTGLGCTFARSLHLVEDLTILLLQPLFTRT